MNEEVIERIKQFSIKLILTIPAIIIGILSVLSFIFKPVIELWFPTPKEDNLTSPLK